MLPSYQILSPGTHIWGLLAEQDQSFIVSFHDLYAVVSFNTAQSLSDIDGTTAWVRVGLLQAKDQPKLSDKEVVSLEDIGEDAEMEVKSGTASSQRILHIRWKQQVISIQINSTCTSGMGAEIGSAGNARS